MADLRLKTFGGWPEIKTPPQSGELASAEHEGVRLTIHEFVSQPGIKLRFYLAKPIEGGVKAVHLEVVDESNWRDQMNLARAGFGAALKAELDEIGSGQEVSEESKQKLAGWMRYIRDKHEAFVTVPPRGVGMSALSADKKYRDMVRRRFMLLGQTLAGMQVWDTCRAAEAVRQIEAFAKLPLHFHASPSMSEVGTFAVLFAPEVASVTLANEPRPDKEAPDFLNWSRIVTPQQLLALARQRVMVNIHP
jgi:hypothetical protein